MVRRKLVEIPEAIDFDAIRLKHLFQFTVDDAIRFLVSAGALKNKMECGKCGNEMNVQKWSKLADGLWAKMPPDKSYNSINQRASESVPRLQQSLHSLLVTNGFNHRIIFNEKRMEKELVNFGISMDSFGGEQMSKDVDSNSDRSSDEEAGSSMEEDSYAQSKSKKCVRRGQKAPCIKCKETKTIRCRQMCQPCYNRHLHPKPLVLKKPSQSTYGQTAPCIQCKKTKKLYCKDMCHICYRRSLRQLPGHEDPNCCCIKCWKVAKIFAKGMCEKCYNSKKKKEYALDKSKHRECKECKRIRPHYCFGRCATCHLRMKKQSRAPAKCQRCEQVKVLKTKILCDNCCRIKRDETNKQMCRNCGKIRPYVAKEMCRTCYNKVLRYDPKKEQECRDCKQVRRIYCRQLCKTCYSRQSYHSLDVDIRKHRECQKCKQMKPIYGNEMCSPCYQQVKKKLLKTDVSKHRECRECKKVTVINSWDMCKNCYNKKELAALKADPSRHKECQECKGISIKLTRNMCRKCYCRIFVCPKRKLAKINARIPRPKKIPKIELESDSEGDWERPLSVSSGEVKIEPKELDEPGPSWR